MYRGRYLPVGVDVDAATGWAGMTAEIVRLVFVCLVFVLLIIRRDD